MPRCAACDRDFSSQQALDQHCRDSPAHAETYNCDECGRAFSSQQALDQHCRDSPAHAETYNCDECGRAFSSQQALDQHCRDSPAHAETYNCDECGRAFSSQQALDQHRLNSPAHAVTYDCDNCDRTFGSQQALDQHLLDSPAHAAHAVTYAVTYDCEDCDRAFSSQQALDQHRLDSPSHAQNDKCDDCRSNPDMPWCMRPDLHEDVSCLLSDENLCFTFHHSDMSGASIKDYDSNIMGRFICQNTACSSHGWDSNLIPVTIRLYPGKQYNARVYRQRCKSCTDLGQHILDSDNYAERIAYRLKKWSGIVMEVPSYSGQRRGPHEKAFCEGCKAGHCSGLLDG